MPVDWSTSALLIFVALLVLFSLGVPVAFTFGILGFLGLYFLANATVALSTVGMYLYSVPLNFTLLAAPLFIFMAQILIVSEFGVDLYLAAEKALSGTRASLALATIAAGTVFAAATGSSIASCATLGPAAVPEMMKRGYAKSLAAGCVAGAGGLAVVIPPSVPFILYAYVAEVSLAKLFIAGVIPGLLMAGFMATYTIMRVWWQPSLAPTEPGLPLKERLAALPKVLPVALLIVLVLGSIYGGITTPTEAAAVGALGSLFLSVAYGRLTRARFRQALLQTGRTTGFAFFIVVNALIFGFLMGYARIPIHLSETAMAYGLSAWATLAAISIVFLFLGCLMDSASLLLVAVPLLLPTLLAFNFDPIWLGIVLLVNIELGMLTPPVGMNLFVLQGVTKPYGIVFSDIVRGTTPYLGAQMLAWLAVILFPALALWLPSKMG